MPRATHVALPDGRHVWARAAGRQCWSAAAAHALPDAATDRRRAAKPRRRARLVTTMTRHSGGAWQVHARIDESFTLVYDALRPERVRIGVAHRGGCGDGDRGCGRGACRAGNACRTRGREMLSDSLTTRYMPSGMTRWSPDSGETIAERLGPIVGPRWAGLE